MIRIATVLLLLVVVLSVRLSKQDNEDSKELFYFPLTRPDGDVYFFETFNDEEEFTSKWVQSEATKDGADADVAKYDGDWQIANPTLAGFDGDMGLEMTTAAKHYAIAAKLDRPFVFADHDYFIVQYEVCFKEGMTCGGAYIKLLSESDSLDLENFQDKTPYTIMFGPDKCGSSSKVHYIFRHKNPVTGKYEEKHAKAVDTDMGFFDDKKTHLFRLIIKSDNTYNIVIDDTVASTGSLLEDFQPPVNPPAEIDDPDDKKPEEWDEREKIPDPSATKPEDWDEDAPAKIADPDAVKPGGWLDDGPEYVPDPDASKPEDWDDEDDGEWEAPTVPNPACEEVGCGPWSPPMIANPQYKGKWSAPLIENPSYDGIWKPRRIANPEFFEDSNPYNMTTIGAVGLELWTMNKGVIFDNFIISSELVAASTIAQAGWRRKWEYERAADPSSSLGPFLDWFIENANDRPYLWILYILALVMPFVLCAACCVRSSKKPEDEAARRKKTDEPQEDDKSRPEEEDTDGIKPEESFVAAAEDEEEEPPKETATIEELEETDDKPSSRPESRQSGQDKSGSRPESRNSQEEPAVNDDTQEEVEEATEEPQPSPGKETRGRRRNPRRET